MAEMFASSIVRLIVSIAILAAVYLFFVRPILDTTNNAFDSVNSTFNSAFDDVGLDHVNLDQVKKGNFSNVQKQIKQANLGKKQQQQAEKLLHCIQRVQPDTTKMQTCAQKFQP